MNLLPSFGNGCDYEQVFSVGLPCKGNNGCLPGFVSEENDNVVTCKECAPGTYSSSVGSTKCELCPTNTYSNFHSQVCIKCPLGAMSNPGSSYCRCQPGYAPNGYSADVDCIPCSGGTFASDWYRACVNCPKDTYSTALADTCIPCPNGSHAQPGSYMCSCLPGFWQFGSGANFRCELCPPGTDSAGGGDSCKCPAGFKQLGVTGKTTCLRCPTGKYSVSGDSYCTSSCPGNTYTAIVRRNWDHNPDEVVEEWTGKCLPCPANSYSVFDSDYNRSQCVCMPRFVSNNAKDMSKLRCKEEVNLLEYFPSVQWLIGTFIAVLLASYWLWKSFRSKRQQHNCINCEAFSSIDFKGLIVPAVPADKCDDWFIYLQDLGLVSCQGIKFEDLKLSKDKYANADDINKSNDAVLTVPEAAILSILFNETHHHHRQDNDNDNSHNINHATWPLNSMLLNDINTNLTIVNYPSSKTSSTSNYHILVKIALSGLHRIPNFIGIVYCIARLCDYNKNIPSTYYEGGRIHWGRFILCTSNLDIAHKHASESSSTDSVAIIFRISVVSNSWLLSDVLLYVTRTLHTLGDDSQSTSSVPLPLIAASTTATTTTTTAVATTSTTAAATTTATAAATVILSPNLVFNVTKEYSLNTHDGFGYIDLKQGRSHDHV